MFITVIITLKDTRETSMYDSCTVDWHKKLLHVWHDFCAVFFLEQIERKNNLRTYMNLQVFFLA